MGTKDNPPLNTHPAVFKKSVKADLLRRGKGYSRGELKTSGLSVANARRIGLYVDERRRSIYKHNVENLRKILQSLRPKDRKTLKRS